MKKVFIVSLSIIGISILLYLLPIKGNNKMQKVLVAGATGYLGTSFCETSGENPSFQDIEGRQQWQYQSSICLMLKPS